MKILTSKSTINYIFASNLGDVLYHVTLTEHVPSIQERGIVPMGAPSNWVKGTGERYGEGDIHSFQTLKDAVNWAAKWDWEISSSWGSGKISIIKFSTDDTPWDIDESDPISQSMKEKDWLKRAALIPPENIIDIIPVTEELVVKTLRN